MIRLSSFRVVFSAITLWCSSSCLAQERDHVTLPSPRLLTTFPMGGKVGTNVEVSITGKNIEDVSGLLFSNPKITAKPKVGANDVTEKNKFIVTIGADVPKGVYDARLMTRLGVSSARAFSVGALDEIVRNKPNNTQETALELTLNSVCNASTTEKAVDYYSFEATKGQKVVVDCAAAGIDSRLVPVVIVADIQGRDLVVNRIGGVVEFTPETDGRYLIKVHSLIFKGGPEEFYRVALLPASGTNTFSRQASTHLVGAFSRPLGEQETAKVTEVEPNNVHAEAQKISLPSTVSGRFFPAGDVDVYEFAAKKGEVWWVEVVSQRLGLPTNPVIQLQRFTTEGGADKWVDMEEIKSIPSPLKPSSNGYSYSGPPYDAGSLDPMGKIEIKEDGRYHIQIRDLFGGSRNDPNHAYQLVLRKAAPDFAFVVWAFHKELRNGDRAALSKPVALRGGFTMPFEVSVIRKDGFDGEIELALEGLPPGVYATGVKVPKGSNTSSFLVTADEKAPPGLALAKVVGRAQVNGATLTRVGAVASQIWPIIDAVAEGQSPKGRLMADLPISVGGVELAPVSVAPSERKVWEARVGEKLTIPLTVTVREEMSSASVKVKQFGDAFKGLPEFDIPMKDGVFEAVLDFGVMKTPPGEYTLSMFGDVTFKHRHNPDSVGVVEEELKKADLELVALTAASTKLTEDAKTATAEAKVEADRAAKGAAEKMKAAEVLKAEITKRVKTATNAAAPTITVELLVVEPVRIVVKAPAPKAVEAKAETPKSADLDFFRDIYPIVKANCISCHNKTTTKAALNMETPELIKKGGDSGPALVAGKGEESLIVRAASHLDDYIMPPKNNKGGAVDLTPSEIALVKNWINQGAKHSVQPAREVAWEPFPTNVNPIYTVAMTPDGRFGACGRANQIFLYDLATRNFDMRLADQSGKMAHRGLVQSLAFNSDGTRLASSSFREVKIWRQEKKPPVLLKGDAALDALISTVSPDGKLLLSADKAGALHVLDAHNGKILKSIPSVNTSGVKLLSFSPDATLVAVCGADATLSLWGLKDGNRIAAQSGVAGVNALTWTQDGKSLVSAGDDQIVRLWTVPVGGLAEFVAPKELKGGTSKLTALVGTADSTGLLVASEDNKVRLWNLAEGKVQREFSVAGVVALAAAPDGSQFAAGCGDGGVRVLKVAEGKVIAELRDDLAFASRMGALAWAEATQGLEYKFFLGLQQQLEGENKAMDVLLKKAMETIEKAKTVLPVKQNAVKPAIEATLAAKKALQTVSDLIAAAPEAKADDKLKAEAKAAQDKLMAATMAESTAVASLSASEQNVKDAEADVAHINQTVAANKGKIVAALASSTSAKQASDKANADIIAAKEAHKALTVRPLSMAFSANSQTVAVLFNDGIERIWAIASGHPIEQVSVAGAIKAGAIVGCSDGRFVACSANATIAITGLASEWSLERVIGASKGASPFADRVNVVRFSPDGKTLAVGGGEPSRSGDISLWDVASGKLLKTWAECHSDSVLALDFSPDGKRLASGGADKLARVFEVATGKLTNTLEGHTHYVMGVAFRSDGRVLASAGADGIVLVWDMQSGERKKKIEGWGKKEVTSLQYIGASSELVTSAGDNLIRVIKDDGTEVRAIKGLPNFMHAAASDVAGSVIVGGGEDAFFRVLDGSTGKELAQFGAK